MPSPPQGGRPSSSRLAYAMGTVVTDRPARSYFFRPYGD